MPDSELNQDDAMLGKSNSAETVRQNNMVTTKSALNLLLYKQEELHRSINALQHQMLIKSPDNGKVAEGSTSIESKLDKIHEEILRQPAQLRGLKRQVNLITAVVGQSRYKSLVDRLLNFLDLIKKAQKEFNKQYEDNVNFDFIKPLYTELLQILNVNDVDILEVNEGQKFDAKIHKCIFTQQVSDESSSNKIYQIVKPGYYYTGSDDGEMKILRHTEVVVTQFHQAADKEIVDKEIVDKEIVDKEIVVKEADNNEANNIEEDNLLPDLLNESNTQFDESIEKPDDPAPEQLKDESLIEPEKGD